MYGSAKLLSISVWNSGCSHVNIDCTTADCLKIQRKTQNPTVCVKKTFIEDVKALVKVVVIFLPLPVYWALNDQQGSVFIIQALQMDCRLWDNVLLLPDQMLLVNALMVLAFIPILTLIVYPLVSKIVKVTPLRKMSVGGLVAASAFIVSAFVQLEINKSLAPQPPPGYSYITVINTSNCSYSVTSDNKTITILEGSSVEKYEDMFIQKQGFDVFYFKPNEDCINSIPEKVTFNVTFDYGYLHISENGVFMAETRTDKPMSGNGGHFVGVIVATDTNMYQDGIALCRVDEDSANDDLHSCNYDNPNDFYYSTQYYDEDEKNDVEDVYDYHTTTSNDKKAVVFKNKDIKPGSWRLYYLNGNPKTSTKNLTVKYTGYQYTQYRQGGVFIVSLTGEHTNPNIMLHQTVPNNGVSLLWQIPQLTIISIAEVLISVTGWEFAYNEALLL
ncbi:unnamed protein product [Bursaphelenchus okinawaensis]|uniref:Uncharacterized protein n=1 Tax=Bursaphelenchus okinawaensis TaxID=465554 RepID=A0A811KAT0_9BILA|nr:unnamed protein product [Bursaphelenchus okinawaensis]CAG9096293.1 unnamed protein product [Bursaphelenchus okinawaensis]